MTSMIGRGAENSSSLSPISSAFCGPIISPCERTGDPCGPSIATTARSSRDFCRLGHAVVDVDPTRVDPIELHSNSTFPPAHLRSVEVHSMMGISVFARTGNRCELAAWSKPPAAREQRCCGVFDVLGTAVPHCGSETRAELSRMHASSDHRVKFGAAAIVLSLGLVALGSAKVARADTFNIVVSSITGSGQGKLTEYSGTTGQFLVADSANNPNLHDPFSLAVGPDGNLYVSDLTYWGVHRYNAQTLNFIDTFVPHNSGGLQYAFDLKFGPDGNLYVSDGTNSAVRRYNGVTGASMGDFVPSGSGGLLTPSIIAFGPDGNLYVSSEGTNQVLRYNGITGAFMDVFIQPGHGLNEPKGLVFAGGYLFVGNYGDNSIFRYNAQTGAFVDDFIPSGSHGLVGPGDFKLGPDGNLYVPTLTDVMRFNAQTGDYVDTIVPAGSGGLLTPTSVELVNVPEPASLILLATGATVTMIRRRVGRLRDQHSDRLTIFRRK
jgi:DNA-binding beta-propeller fold protein YncE